MKELRVVLYTVITGKYDWLPMIKPERNLEYWLFTDNRAFPTSTLWNKALLENPFGWNPRRLSRLPKLRPHHFLPPHDISIYTYANVRFLRPIRDFALSCIQESPIAIHRHPSRECIYSEGAKCIELKLDDEETIRKQLERYRSENFPPDFGLAENNFIVRRNVERVNQFCDLWQSEYSAGSQRDQLCFMYCVWRSKLHPYMIQQNPRRNHFFQRRRHKLDSRNHNRK